MDTDLALLIGVLVIFFFPIVLGICVITYRIIFENFYNQDNYIEVQHNEDIV